MTASKSFYQAAIHCDDWCLTLAKWFDMTARESLQTDGDARWLTCCRWLHWTASEYLRW